MDAEDSTDHIAAAIKTLAIHVKYLGVGDAGTTMGALEFLATQIREGDTAIALALETLASAVEKLAAAANEGNNKLSEIAESIADAVSELKGDAK
jgi:hypothetical protein